MMKTYTYFGISVRSLKEPGKLLVLSVGLSLSV